jgi:hypothetical protein
MPGIEDYSIYPSPRDLPADLRAHCVEAGDSGIFIFHHRFCVTPFPLAFPVPIRELINEREKSATAALVSGDIWSYLQRHEKPYRPEVLTNLVADGYFDDKPEEYWALVGQVWVNIDLPEDSPAWAEMLDVPLEGSHAMMCENDRALLKAMPDVIRVWRGVEGEDEDYARAAATSGHSWSTSAEIAARFAKGFARSAGEAWVASALVPKTDVVAYLTDRGEAEIILRPHDVEDLDIEMTSLGSKPNGFSELPDRLVTTQSAGGDMTLNDKIQSHLEGFKNEENGHKLFPLSDWRYEVDNDDTNQGYDDWLESQIEYEVDDVTSAIDRLIYRACKATDGEISEIDFNKDVVDTFSDMRIIDDEAVDRANGFLGNTAEKPVFGESFGSVPADVAADISRIAHLGMVFFEGRCTSDKLTKVIIETADKHGITGSGVEAARARAGGGTPEP